MSSVICCDTGKPYVAPEVFELEIQESTLGGTMSTTKDPCILQLIPAPSGWSAYTMLADDKNKCETYPLPVVGFALVKKIYGYEESENIIRLAVKSLDEDRGFTVLDREFMAESSNEIHFIVAPGEDFDSRKNQAEEDLLQRIARTKKEAA
jgi:hypothetical protein